MNGMNAVKAILLLLFASVYAANGPVVSGEDDKRYASNKAAGLFPFPRVGRAGGRLVWSLEAPSDHLAVKRQGLFSFPRVGRSGRQRFLPGALMFSAPRRVTAVGTPMIAREMGVGELAKRDGDQVAGMWFGPRLGRRDKRETEPAPWTFVALKEYPAVHRREGFTPHLGRESSEEAEYPNNIDEEDDFGPITDLALKTRSDDKSLNKSNQAI